MFLCITGERHYFSSRKFLDMYVQMSGLKVYAYRKDRYGTSILYAR